MSALRLFLSILLSWLVATVIHSAAFKWDGIEFSVSDVPELIPLFLLTGIYIAIYFVVVGGTALIVMRKLRFYRRRNFVVAGILCSLPMLFSGEIEWQIAAILSGVLSGTLIAFVGGAQMPPNKKFEADTAKCTQRPLNWR
ncbi:MAG: apolipoprotein N-acyltransferase [Glaciecola sp.]